MDEVHRSTMDKRWRLDAIRILCCQDEEGCRSVVFETNDATGTASIGELVVIAADKIQLDN